MKINKEKLLKQFLKKNNFNSIKKTKMTKMFKIANAHLKKQINANRDDTTLKRFIQGEAINTDKT